jgi:hypothetical protein
MTNISLVFGHSKNGTADINPVIESVGDLIFLASWYAHNFSERPAESRMKLPAALFCMRATALPRAGIRDAAPAAGNEV